MKTLILLWCDLLCMFGFHDRRAMRVGDLEDRIEIKRCRRPELAFDFAVVERDEWIERDDLLDRWWVMRLGRCERPGCGL